MKPQWSSVSRSWLPGGAVPDLAKWLLLALLLCGLAACSTTPAVITWETASEVNTAGFNVYRSPAGDGPWTKVNDAIIPPAEDPVRGGAYRFTDPAARPGVTYFYLLEEVEQNGQVNRFAPIEVERQSLLAGWPLWLGLATLAVLAGWFLGGRIRSSGKVKVDGT